MKQKINITEDMQNIISSLPVNEREAEFRRASIMTVVYALGILLAIGLGLFAMISLGSRVGFYGMIAAAAAMMDPLRRHLGVLTD